MFQNGLDRKDAIFVIVPLEGNVKLDLFYLDLLSDARHLLE